VVGRQRSAEAEVALLRRHLDDGGRVTSLGQDSGVPKRTLRRRLAALRRPICDTSWFRTQL
jgi:hypothetical protein